MDIWSRGCNPHSRFALPVLFAWELVTSALAMTGMYRRSHYAALAEAAAQKQFGERLDAAMEFQRKREREIRDQERIERNKEEGKDEQEKASNRNSEAKTDNGRRSDENIEQPGRPICMEGCRDEGRVRKQLAEAIEREDEQILQKKRRGSKARPSFGPMFSLPFDQDGQEVDG